MVRYEEKAGVSYECPEHGRMSEAEAARPDRRRVDHPEHGPAFFLLRLELIDEDPNLLLSGAALFLEDEAPAMRKMGSQLGVYWRARLKALEEERELRRANPKRTVAG